MTTNFADSTREPTDEELAELMHEAFSDVVAANDRALAALRSQIARERQRLRAATTDGKPSAGG